MPLRITTSFVVGEQGTRPASPTVGFGITRLIQLDNQYYKLMSDEDYGGTKCCGGKNQHGCHRRGQISRQGNWEKTPFFLIMQHKLVPLRPQR